MGIKVAQSKEGIVISQEKNALDVLKEIDMNCKPVVSPISCYIDCVGTLIDRHFTTIVFSLKKILFLGKARNEMLLLNLVSKLNTRQSHHSFMNFCG